jgi:hypothetical protein
VAEPQNASLQRTDEAVRRLGAALDRLESAVARVSTGDLLLAGELRDAHEDVAQLEDTTRVVAQRLDATIARLRVLLEE